MRCSPRQGVEGFSLIELLIALGLALVVTAGVFALVNPSGDMWRTQPEAADVQQRLRAAADALWRDVLVAGAPPELLGGVSSPIASAAVFPMRVGRVNPDAAGSFVPSRMALWFVAAAAPQARLAGPLASASGIASILPGAGCLGSAPACGFRSGMTVAVAGSDGAWDLFSVSGAVGTTLTLQHNLRDGDRVHGAGSPIAEVTARTYMLKADAAAGFSRLVRYDGGGGTDVPVVDHLVDLRFEYFGDAEPPALVPGTGPDNLRVTYGPPPPQRTQQPTAYPPGENCVFARAEDGTIVSRLPALAPGPVLVALNASMLVDGPWCPDAGDSNRYDADVLRVRQVAVTLRVEAAAASLRGPAGPLFSRGGTARDGRMVPDRVTRLVVTPRPLNMSR